MLGSTTGWQKSILLFLAGVAPAIIMAQQVYKWRDAQGTIHYSEQPPPIGVKSSVLRLAADMNTGKTESLEDSKAASSEGGQASDSIVALDQAQRHSLCQTARNNFKLLSGQVIVVNGGDITTARQLDEEQRAKARDEAQAQIGQYCDDK
jgi:protein-tyrosine-phosphatase